jgi:hypothetical protein
MITNHSATIPDPSCAPRRLISVELNLHRSTTEIAMTILTIGKRRISLEQIAYVEPFDPAANPEFKPEKDFKARLVLLNRDAVLTENSPEEFSEANDFHLFTEDNIAVNPSLAFRVETFAPTENFKPGKAYRTRIKWRDANGTEQSKLLVMEPETVVAELSHAVGIVISIEQKGCC